MPIDWTKLLQTGLNVGAQWVPRLSASGLQLGGLQIPNSVAGLGLGLTGAAMNKEPGEVTQARQFERNLFESPTFLPERVSQLASTGQQYFDPLIRQRRNRAIEDISQRFAAAFPKTVGAQGPEFGTLARYITDQALPAEMNFYGGLGVSGFNAQQQAARDILSTSRPNPFAEALSQFGGLLTARDLLGMGGQTANGGSAFPAGNLPGAVGATGAGSTGLLTASAPTQLGQLSPASLAIQLLQGGDLQNLGGLLASGALKGMPFPAAVDASTAAGQLIQKGINAGLVESPAAQSLGGLSTAGATGFDAGLAGPGLLGPAGLTGTGLLSSAVSALGSGGIGYLIGRQFRAGSATQVKAGLGGAAGGAAAGFAVGGPVGGVIGAIVGGLSGIVGSSRAEHARKDASIQAEAQATAQARPAALQTIRDFFPAAQQMDATVRQLRAGGQFDAKLVNLVNANDPVLRQLFDKADAIAKQRRAYPQSVPFTEQGVGAFMDLFTFTAGDGLIYDPRLPRMTPSGSEGPLALIESAETGKFGPGVDRLNNDFQVFGQARNLLAELMTLMQQR